MSLQAYYSQRMWIRCHIKKYFVFFARAHFYSVEMQLKPQMRTHLYLYIIIFMFSLFI
jgi:hypothetical protein